MTANTETATSALPIRRIAEGRQFALAHGDPVIGHVSAGAFWAIWRDGCNWALVSSAKMSTLFQEVGEWILVMAEAQEFSPHACEQCGHVCGSQDAGVVR